MGCIGGAGVQVGGGCLRSMRAGLEQDLPGNHGSKMGVI